jgi:hypothetical protein
MVHILAVFLLKNGFLKQKPMAQGHFSFRRFEQAQNFCVSIGLPPANRSWSRRFHPTESFWRSRKEDRFWLT